MVLSNGNRQKLAGLFCINLGWILLMWKGFSKQTYFRVHRNNSKKQQKVRIFAQKKFCGVLPIFHKVFHLLKVTENTIWWKNWVKGFVWVYFCHKRISYSISIQKKVIVHCGMQLAWSDIQWMIKVSKWISLLVSCVKGTEMFPEQLQSINFGIMPQVADWNSSCFLYFFSFTSKLKSFWLHIHSL